MSTWNIDTTHSSIGFSVRHMVFAKVKGRFTSWKGTLELDPTDATKASVEVTVDAASVDTGTPDRDNHLRSADFFDAARFPEVTFRSTGVERAGAALRLTGALTIRGVTRDVVLEVRDGGRAKDPWGNQRVAFSATTSIDRREFGLTWNQALEAGGLLVGERVDLELEIQAAESAVAKAA